MPMPSSGSVSETHRWPGVNRVAVLKVSVIVLFGWFVSRKNLSLCHILPEKVKGLFKTAGFFDGTGEYGLLGPQALA
jgi:hypothetical protein